MPEGPTIVHWNLYNWITVVLMVAIGMAVVGFAASALRQYLPGTGGMRGS